MALLHPTFAPFARGLRQGVVAGKAAPARPTVPRWVVRVAGRLGYRLLPGEAGPLDLMLWDVLASRLAARVARADAERPVALLRVDVDELERVHEALSVSAGDQVLATVGRRIVDVVGGDAEVRRVSGAGFAVILVGAPGAAAAVADRMRRTVTTPVLVQGHVVEPTISIGIALAMPDLPVAEVLQNAALALRRAREAGGDRVEVARAELARRAAERLALEESLRRALAGQDVSAWYQPIVDLASGGVAGYEALCRWTTADGTQVPPAEFIPIAECAGLVPEIDLLVLGQALTLLERLPEGRFVSVNVSPASLTHPDFTDRVCVLLDAAMVDLRRLHLEITETALPSDIDIIRGAMLRLRGRGARWYLDDFGTGYSSLSNLGSLPVDGLKLDMSFTRGIECGDETHARLANGLLALAQGLDLVTIAEGVESPGTAQRLRDQGWALGQGWLFGHAEPMPYRA